ncbi:MAG: F0F1 ATP synthase subunit B [Lachnospiraceae bacterium]|nr:F0F1 ATP synthase subunit B [Lachnospiraceae bacterium]
MEEEASLRGKIFGLDLQILFDALILGLAVLFLFFLLSYLLFNPARDFIRKRQERIASDLATAAEEKKEAMEFKAEYDARLRDADAEVDRILSEGKRRAKRRESEIIDAANAEATRIMERTEREIEMEKSKVRDDVKKEMVAVATEMAGRFVSESMTQSRQEQLVDEVLREIGDSTWQEQ